MNLNCLTPLARAHIQMCVCMYIYIYIYIKPFRPKSVSGGNLIVKPGLNFFFLFFVGIHKSKLKKQKKRIGKRFERQTHFVQTNFKTLTFYKTQSETEGLDTYKTRRAIFKIYLSHITGSLLLSSSRILYIL